MVRLVVGGKGKGKTKILLDQANEAIKTANGNIVFIDKNSKHMYELNNKVRLIDTSNLPLKNSDQFIGVLLGVLSQDHDIEKIYLDNLLKLAKLDEIDLNTCLHDCVYISDRFNVEFIIGVSADRDVLDDDLQLLVSIEC